ncbi:MAG: 3-deoxy-D-manno-octulosonic acid transferase [Alphaproteobacteria bacterium]
MLILYSWVIRIAAPLLRLYIWRRVRTGKEDKQRYRERFGLSTLPRPQGDLIWVHAASVGESLAVLPLIEELVAQNPKQQILMTTGTVTAATLMAKRLPPICLHQYIPLDVPHWIKRFLDHWRPSTAIFVESDLWPNILLTCKQRQIRLVLVNARISPKSQNRFRKFPHIVHKVLACFDLIISPSQRITDFISSFDLQNVVTVDNIKFAASPLSYDPMAYSNLKADIGDRPLWLAASTHPGEEQIAAYTHRHLQKKFPNVLTIIVPRHPVRGPKIAKDLKGFAVLRRTQTARIPNDCQIYIADTLGEIGLFYALSPITLVGGSFVEGFGGHNPIEPALLDCAILWGPHIYNSKEICQLLEPSARPVQTPDELAQGVEALLCDPAEATKIAKEVKELVEGQQDVLKMMLPLLRPYLVSLHETL